MSSRIRSWLETARTELLEADTRGLAVFRIGLGVGLLAYLVSRVTGDSFVAFHTDLGLFPRSLAMTHGNGPGAFSLFYAIGAPFGVAVAFAVAFLIVASFAVGYRTRTSAVLTTLVLLSLHHRMPAIVNAAMVISHALMLLAWPLPLGNHYSVDAWISHRRGASRVEFPRGRVRSIGILALRVELFCIYFFNAANKTGVTWRDGSAIHYALYDDRVARASAAWVRVHTPTWLLEGATYGTLALEVAIGVAVVSPFLPRLSRRFATAAIVFLHLGIATVLRLGPFPVIFPAAALFLAASGDWTSFDAWLEPRLRRFGLGGARGALVVYTPQRLDPLARPGTVLRETYFAALLVLLVLVNRHDNPIVNVWAGPIRLPVAATVAVSTLYIPQGFALFAPDPSIVHGVFVIDMTMEDGRHVDPLRHAPPRFDVFGRGPYGTDYFWQIYQTVLAGTTRDAPAWREFMNYLARIPILEYWPGERKVRSIAVHYIYGASPAPGGDANRPTDRVLARMESGSPDMHLAAPIQIRLPTTGRPRRMTE